MYVIVETGSKQYRLEKGSVVDVELLGQKAGKTVKLDKVLLLADGKNVEVGRPYLKSVKVECDVLGSIRAKKVVAFKKKRRKSQSTKIGHRQDLTRLKVKGISTT